MFKNRFIHSQQCIKKYLRNLPLFKMVQCVNSIYKGRKKILCAPRLERVHKNEGCKFTVFQTLVREIVFMHELANSAKNFSPCSLRYFVRFLCTTLIN